MFDAFVKSFDFAIALRIVVLLLCFFPEGIIYMWTDDINLAQNTSPIVRIMVIAYFLNAMMHMPYQCQLAFAWTGLAIRTNIVAVSILVPAIIVVVPIYGAVAAAWICVILNAGYVLISIQFMHRRILSEEKWRWYFKDIIFPILASLVIVLVFYNLHPVTFTSRLEWFIFLLITGIFTLLSSFFAATLIRNNLLELLKGFLSS